MNAVTDSYAKAIAEQADEILRDSISDFFNGYSFEDLVERIWNEAYDEGHNNGYDTGYREGHEDGYKDGYGECKEEYND